MTLAVSSLMGPINKQALQICNDWFDILLASDRSHSTAQGFIRLIVNTDPVFYYPSIAPAGFEFLKCSVKPEFSSLANQQPDNRHPVQMCVTG